MGDHESSNFEHQTFTNIEPLIYIYIYIYIYAYIYNHPRVVLKLEMGWSYTSASPLCVRKHVMGWLLCVYIHTPFCGKFKYRKLNCGTHTFFLWRAPQQMLRTHRSLEAYCATLWWRWLVFFPFFLVMEHRWNETDKGKPKYSGKNLSQCNFVYHKSHMDWPSIEPGPTRWEAGD
jgi:hypothetical protein